MASVVFWTQKLLRHPIINLVTVRSGGDRDHRAGGDRDHRGGGGGGGVLDRLGPHPSAVSSSSSSMYGNTYGLSPQFLESLGIDGPLHTRVFVANVSPFRSLPLPSSADLARFQISNSFLNSTKFGSFDDVIASALTTDPSSSLNGVGSCFFSCCSFLCKYFLGYLYPETDSL